MNDIFNQKLCVITGAGSGIGRALALDLAQRGAALALSDINQQSLDETRKLIGNPPSNRIRFDRLDVADADAIKTYSETIRQSLGNANFVFNVAGLTRVGSFLETPLDKFGMVMEVNFWGVVRMTKAFLPQLIKTKGGLINISSLFGLIGFPGQTHYCASKFAVRGFSETLAQELVDQGVCVTSAHPGGVATNIVNSAEVDAFPTEDTTKADMRATFDKAAITSAARAAKIILNGAAKKKRRVVVGRDAKIMSFIQRLFPQGYAKVLGMMLPKDLS